MVSGRSYSDRCVVVVRPVQMTLAPASPSAAAMPRPAPRVAPATTATRPRRASRSGDHVTPKVCHRRRGAGGDGPSGLGPSGGAVAEIVVERAEQPATEAGAVGLHHGCREG